MFFKDEDRHFNHEQYHQTRAPTSNILLGSFCVGDRVETITRVLDVRRVAYPVLKAYPGTRIYNDRRNLCLKVACGDYLKAYIITARPPLSLLLCSTHLQY